MISPPHYQPIVIIILCLQDTNKLRNQGFVSTKNVYIKLYTP